MRDQLRETFECQAEWRREKAVEYPDDRRNLKAADLFDRLAATVDAIPADVLNVYANLDPETAVLEQQMHLRSVGFHFNPPDAETFLRTLIDDLHAKWPKLKAV